MTDAEAARHAAAQAADDAHLARTAATIGRYKRGELTHAQTEALLVADIARVRQEERARCR